MVTESVSPARGTWLWMRAIGFTLLFFFILVVATLVISGAIGWKYWQSFSQASGMSFVQARQLASYVLTTPGYSSEKLHLLILGTDAVANRQGDPVLTDTIMLASFNLAKNKVNLISLPRDLWSEKYSTKINALYVYGQDQFLDSPQQLTELGVQDLTGIDPNYTLIIKLDDLAKIIDILNGIEIEVKEGFIDDKFPRDDVDIRTVSDPKLLYETVEFKSGKQMMTGEQVLKYVRSRHSGDLTTGTDVARGERQQQVISAIVARISSTSTLSDPKVMGQLYAYYQTTYQSNLPLTTVIDLAKSVAKKKQVPSIVSISLPIYPDDPQGIIFHPEQRLYQGQWVYAVKDAATFKNYFLTRINE